MSALFLIIEIYILIFQKWAEWKISGYTPYTCIYPTVYYCRLRIQYNWTVICKYQVQLPLRVSIASYITWSSLAYTCFCEHFGTWNCVQSCMGNCLKGYLRFKKPMYVLQGPTDISVCQCYPSILAYCRFICIWVYVLSYVPKLKLFLSTERCWCNYIFWTAEGSPLFNNQ